MRDQLSWLQSWQGVSGTCLNQRHLSRRAEMLLKARMQGGCFAAACCREVQPPLLEGLCSKYDLEPFNAAPS